MIGIAERIKPALWFPGRNDDALVGDLWRGCVGYWPMWGGAGERAMDLSGNGNHGTLTGMDPATDWVPTEMGMALDFDGSNDHIAVGDPTSLQITGPITVMCWANFSVSLFNKPLVSKWGSDEAYNLTVIPTDQITFTIRVAEANKAARSAKTYDDGLWHQYVGVWNGANVLLYVDGGAETIVGDATSGPIDSPANLSLVLGAYESGTNGFVGMLAGAGIWNRALSAGEIAYLYRNPFVMIRQPDFAPFWDVVGVPPVPPVVTGAAPGITIGDDTIGLLTAIPNPGMTISDVNPTVIVEQ